MLNVLKRIFPREVIAKSDFSFPELGMEEIIKTNRESLKLIDNWIDESAFRKSCFSYGVPEFLKPEINKPVGNDLTYTDLMIFIIKKYFININYLEIGVSVGKNFFQLLNARFNDSTFTGFDIEEINPILEHQLDLQTIEQWDTSSRSIKKGKSSFKRYNFRDTTVNYLSGDVWDENSWAKLKGSKFNMVFSDALHTPKAILFEFEMLVKYDLLDEKFVIVWDDLVGKMKKSFYRIIKRYNKKYHIQDIYLLSINGWVGKNEAPHSVGMIANFVL